MTTKLTRFARELRENSTDAERSFWSRVRAHRLLGHKFKRQQPMGSFIVDFVCLAAKLVVELDGGQHSIDDSDKIRDEWLRNEGFKVLRFWNNDVLSNIDGVIETMMKYLTPSPQPSPIKGEGAGEERER